MAVKTTFSEHDAIDILALYNLGEYVHFAPFTHGSVQTNVFLQTTTQPCVLRYYEQGRTVNSVLFEVNFLAYLKHKHYPCPAPLRNKHGRYAGIYNAKPYVLFEFLEGHHVKHPNAHPQQQLIKKVAELHLLTKPYRPTHKEARWNYSVALCHTLAEQAAMALDTVNAREKSKWHSHELSQLQLPSALPKGVCHADFHFSNVLFKDDTFTALLDFDDANYTFLLFDLVGLIESWAWSYDTVGLDFTEAKKVVAEYMTYRSLNNTEKRHLFDVYKLSILMDCVWYFARGDVTDFYEKRKIDYLNAIGRARFYGELFGDKG